MNSRTRIGALVGLMMLAASQTHAAPREWRFKSGDYTLKAEVIAFNDTTVVLKKEDGGLLAAELRDLREEDRKFIKSKEMKEEAKKSAEEMQTWTSSDGLKVRGRVLAYGKRKLMVGRKRGKVVIDDKRFDEFEPLQQKVILRVLSRIEQQEFEDEKQLTEWAKKLGGAAKPYELEGVLLQLESGDEIGVPFFMFSKEDLAVLEPGWRRWLDEKESEDKREYESFMMRAQAMAYQRDRKAQRQIELLKLQLLGAATGVTDIWQVGLIPAPGRNGRPLAVMVSAPNSEAAARQALARFPGYVVGGSRKASN